MPNFMRDQAAGLRHLFGREQLRVITFTAGAQGVGKSALIANLAVSMAQSGKRVLVLDENPRKNVAVYFGANARGDLQHVIDGEKSLSEILFNVAANIRVLPVARSMKKLQKLTNSQQQSFLACISELEAFADIILVDASSDYALGFSPIGLAAHDTVVVVSGTGESITGAYALIKKVSLGYSHKNFRILVNRVSGPEEAATIYRNLEQVARSRARANLSFAGGVPEDGHFQLAAKAGRTVVGTYPEAEASRVCRKIAADILAWPAYTNGSDRLEQFGQQLLHMSRHIDPVPIYA